MVIYNKMRLMAKPSCALGTLRRETLFLL